MASLDSKFTTMEFSPLVLTLDPKNPRFLYIQMTQEKARDYLLTYSKVRELARDIVTTGGLYPGERIVVYKNEKEDYIVLEGNRRVCACQMLLNPSLIPQSFQVTFPTINDITRQAITEIDVDVVSSREAANQFLASRHIGSVERWDPLAKKKFFEEKFAAGQSIDDIAYTHNYPKGEIKQDIVEYYLFNMAFSLPCWTDSQKENELNLFSIELDRFIRIFNTRGAKRAFKLRANATTLKPESDLPGDRLTRILQRIIIALILLRTTTKKLAHGPKVGQMFQV